MSNQAVLKVDPKNKTFSYLYLKEVPVVYASIQEPKKKYESDEMEYALTAFVNAETRTFLEDEVLLNKILCEVGKDKTKTRKIKYPTSSQVEEGKTNYDPYVNLSGVSLSLNVLKKDGTKNNLLVIDKDGNPFTELVGNGSICTIKCWGYRNKDDLLVVAMSIVQVLEHVPYVGGSGAFEDEELGVSVSYGGKSKATKEPETSSDEFDDDVPF